MKRWRFFLLIAALGFFRAGLVSGGNVSSHVVVFDFQEINEIGFTGNPNLSISSAIPGQQPSDVTDASSICAITTNGTGKRLTASIDAPMPADTSLKVNVEAPSGSGASQGYVTLTTTASNVVTGISQVADSACTVTYKLSATVAAGVRSSDTRTVTFTLSD